MSLSDIMGNMDLSVWAQGALVLFLAVFIGQAIWAFLPRNQDRWKEAQQLPLADEDLQAPAPDHDPTTPTNRRGDA